MECIALDFIDKSGHSESVVTARKLRVGLYISVAVQVYDCEFVCIYVQTFPSLCNCYLALL